MEKIGAKRRRKKKRGRLSAKAEATTLEGGQKISTKYKGVAEAIHSNYVLVSIGEKVWSDKNGGYCCTLHSKDLNTYGTHCSKRP